MHFWREIELQGLEKALDMVPGSENDEKKSKNAKWYQVFLGMILYPKNKNCPENPWNFDFYEKIAKMQIATKFFGVILSHQNKNGISSLTKKTQNAKSLCT